MKDINIDLSKLPVVLSAVPSVRFLSIADRSFMCDPVLSDDIIESMKLNVEDGPRLVLLPCLERVVFDASFCLDLKIFVDMVISRSKSGVAERLDCGIRKARVLKSVQLDAIDSDDDDYISYISPRIDKLRAAGLSIEINLR